MLDCVCMPRAREFDYGRALDRAMRLFWTRGYSNTSLRELLKAMRIGESSFYNAVGSKKALYLACLKHYNEVVTRRRLDALEAAGPVGQAVRRFFTTVLDELDDPRTPRVCLMAGSLSSDVLAEKDLERYVLGEMKLFQAAFVARLERARASRELPHASRSRRRRSCSSPTCRACSASSACSTAAARSKASCSRSWPGSACSRGRCHIRGIRFVLLSERRDGR